MAQGMDSVCVRAFGEALEVIPYTLAENAGLQAIAIVTELRNKCGPWVCCTFAPALRRAWHPLASNRHASHHLHGSGC